MGFQIFGTDHLKTPLHEPCVHCGEPIEYVPSHDGLVGCMRHADGSHLCTDGSGHVACPAQGGIE